MRTKTQSSSDYFANSIQGFRKLSNPIVKPLKAGFLGFLTILTILFFINLISFITGTNEKFGMDSFDFLLAGTGFVLQMTGTVVQSFIR
jgi:hypothetical protein